MNIDTLHGRHILSCADFTPGEIISLMKHTQFIEQEYKKRGCLDILRGKILATLFFEPSTRTRLSFETAMYRLGGHVITVEQGSSSSIYKGETLEDMAQVMSCYADVIAMRHPDPYSVKKFSSTATVPVLNAGDGANEHPTQAFLDLYTIFKLKMFPAKRLMIGLVGDLKNSRTAHSLIKLLKHFDVHFVFISSPEIKLPLEFMNEIKASGCTASEEENLENVITDLDVLYVIRIQRERFECLETYQKVKGSYQVNSKLLKKAKSDLIIMHPLPRIDEIDKDIDADPRAVYFQQVVNGCFVRMALLSLILLKNTQTKGVSSYV